MEYIFKIVKILFFVNLRSDFFPLHAVQEHHSQEAHCLIPSLQHDLMSEQRP